MRIRPIAVLTVVLLLCTSFGSADELIRVSVTPCADGLTLYLWVQGDDATCSNVGGGVLVCQDTDDYSRGACTGGCQEVRLGTLAGCYRGPAGTSPPIILPLYSVECSKGHGGRTYDLTLAPGDSCNQTLDGGGEVMGGECGQDVIINGQLTHIVNSKVECDHGGCTIARHPGDCKVRP